MFLSPSSSSSSSSSTSHTFSSRTTKVKHHTSLHSHSPSCSHVPPSTHLLYFLFLSSSSTSHLPPVNFVPRGNGKHHTFPFFYSFIHSLSFLLSSSTFHLPPTPLHLRPLTHLPFLLFLHSLSPSFFSPPTDFHIFLSIMPPTPFFLSLHLILLPIHLPSPVPPLIHIFCYPPNHPLFFSCSSNHPLSSICLLLFLHSFTLSCYPPDLPLFFLFLQPPTLFLFFPYISPLILPFPS